MFLSRTQILHPQAFMVFWGWVKLAPSCSVCSLLPFTLILQHISEVESHPPVLGYSHCHHFCARILSSQVWVYPPLCLGCNLCLPCLTLCWLLHDSNKQDHTTHNKGNVSLKRRVGAWDQADAHGIVYGFDRNLVLFNQKPRATDTLKFCAVSDFK